MPETLLDAVIKGDLEGVDRFVAAGMDINEPDQYNRTYLHWAAQGGSEELVGKLVKLQADCTVRTSMGVLALHNAVRAGHAGVVRLLVKAGARLECQRFPYDRQVLHWAATHGDLDMIRSLREAGADATALNLLGHAPADIARARRHARAAQMLERLASNEPPDDSDHEPEQPHASRTDTPTHTGEDETATAAAIVAVPKKRPKAGDNNKEKDRDKDRKKAKAADDRDRERERERKKGKGADDKDKERKRPKSRAQDEHKHKDAKKQRRPAPARTSPPARKMAYDRVFDKNDGLDSLDFKIPKKHR